MKIQLRQLTVQLQTISWSASILVLRNWLGRNCSLHLFACDSLSCSFVLETKYLHKFPFALDQKSRCWQSFLFPFPHCPLIINKHALQRGRWPLSQGKKKHFLRAVDDNHCASRFHPWGLTPDTEEKRMNESLRPKGKLGVSYIYPNLIFIRKFDSDENAMFYTIWCLFLLAFFRVTISALARIHCIFILIDHLSM